MCVLKHISIQKKHTVLVILMCIYVNYDMFKKNLQNCSTKFNEQPSPIAFFLVLMYFKVTHQNKKFALTLFTHHGCFWAHRAQDFLRELSFFTGRRGASVCDRGSPIFSGPPPWHAQKNSAPPGMHKKILVPPLAYAKIFWSPPHERTPPYINNEFEVLILGKNSGPPPLCDTQKILVPPPLAHWKKTLHSLTQGGLYYGLG